MDAGRRRFAFGLGAAFLTSRLGTGEAEAAQKKRRAKPRPLGDLISSMPMQRKLAEANSLTYLETEAQLEALKNAPEGQPRVVELPDLPRLTFDPYLKEVGEFVYRKRTYRKYERHFCMPWAHELLTVLEANFAAAFPNDSNKLVVTSAVRPKDTQQYILDRKLSTTAVQDSLHNTGAALDIAFGSVCRRNLDGTRLMTGRGKIQFPLIAYPALPRAQARWLEKELQQLEDTEVPTAFGAQRLLLLRRENSEGVFHIVVAPQFSQRADLLSLGSRQQ